jgi:ABC-2 type transport system permease protein
MINFMVIYVMWLRELKKFVRMKSRIIGTLAMPLFFLGFMGIGFNKMSMPGIPQNINYMSFLVPGMIGMTMLFSSMFAGISVLWDREFGFLKEIMVAPVSRVSIVLGRIAGGITTGMIQGIMILFISMFLGFKTRGIFSIFVALVFLILIATTFIGLGLVFASNMKDMQGFNLIMNFVIFPLFFLSGAMFPLQNLPAFVRFLAHLDPLTYGIDGLRGVLIGTSSHSIGLNLIALVVSSLLMVFLGTYFFEKNESV